MHRPHLDFVAALHRQLPAEGNLCWSPYSVAAALGLAAAGARGATRDQLAAALAPGGELAELGRVLADSAALAEAEVAVANTLWVERQAQFQDAYLQAVRELPGGALRTADFLHDAEGARVAINDDVERTTRGLIKELVGQGMLSADTIAVIVNALYLKVAWLSAFEAAATAPAPFHASSGTRQVPTMRQQESLRYAAAGGWRMVTLPTAAPVVVDVLLPDGPPELPPAEVLAALQEASRPTKVDVTLPRFRVEAAAVLNDPLRQLGVASAFVPGEADFSGITDQVRIFVDLVLHKAVLRVDEQGFEGAAATAVVMRMVSVDLSTPVPFHVDRPFLVLVRHPRTGAVYFVARVVEP
ncbi:MAG: serpin family protein [Micromonosporaceae bacterium]|nr:serpin family protein [Micromonosporaceae bacterium]